MRFHTTILKSGETATGFRVPDDVVDALGAGRRPKVRVTINGFTYRSSIATVDGSPMVGVSAENRAGAGVQGGDEVDVDIEVDTAPRDVRVPRELAEALDAEPAARATFDALSYSNKSWHAIQIESAKTDETRRRRLEKSIEALKQGKPR
ncbi:MAG TPA: YdeI/OmpD-associated family protein [Candidatus Limnocylindrales bacterium]|nr:YdeI/OmpD-associated family protein [Candidatus Limnocylindrales bacterium]